MKLFVERFTPIDSNHLDYISLTNAEVVDPDYLSVRMNSTSAATSEYVVQNINFPIKDGENMLVEFSIVVNKTNTSRNVLKIDYGSYSSKIIFDTDVSNEIKTKIPYVYDEDEDYDITFTLTSYTEDYSITISSLIIKKPTLLEIPIINSDELEINKQIKDFDNITDIKASYTNNIKLKYNKQVIENFGFFNETSTQNIFNTLNGIRAILTTDDAYYISDGSITIQEIIKHNEDYIIDIFFTSYESSFFHSLSSKKLEIPHLWSENTLSDRQDNMVLQTLESDDEYNYGYVYDNYSFYEDSVINNYELHSAYFDFGAIGWLSDDPETIYSKINDEAPVQLGYSGMPALSEPIFKHKYVLENLHKKYGYTVDSDLFNDPKYANLSIAPVKNKEHTYQDVTDFVFEGDISLENKTDKEATCWLPITSCDSDFFTRITAQTITGYDLQYESLEGDNDDFEETYGSKVNDTFYGFKSQKNMRLSAKCSLLLTIEKEDSDETDIRIILTDNAIDFSETSIQMNNYSTYISRKLHIAAGSTMESETYLIEFEIKDILLISEFNNVGYGFRLNIMSDDIQSGYDTIFTADAVLTMTDIKVYEDGIINNPYWMNEQFKFTISEKDFIRDFITKFNLIPEVDYINKIVKYYEFDKFYTDGSVLDWSQKVDRNKELLYKYAKVRKPGNYEFDITTKTTSYSEEKYNDRNTENYGNKIVKSIYENNVIQKINNIIPSLFYKTENDIIYGLYNDEEQKDYGGFPFELHFWTIFTTPYSRLMDNTAIDSKHYRFDEKSDRNDTIVGYLNPIKGKPQTISNYTEVGVPFVGAGLFAYHSILRDSTTTSYDHSCLIPKYLSPANAIDHSSYKSNNLDDNVYFNGLVYDDSLPTTQNLYKEYDREIDNFTLNTNKNDNHILECYVLIGIEEYSTLKLSETIKIDNRYYVIKKISNFIDKRPTKVSLLSWRYRPESYKYVYDSADYTQVVGLSNNVEIDEDKVILNSNVEETIGFMTNYFKSGKTYKVAFNWTSYGDDVDFEGYSTNGYDDFTAISDNTESISFDFVRTDSSIEYHNLLTIKMKAATTGAYFTYSIKISEK